MFVCVCVYLGEGLADRGADVPFRCVVCVYVCDLAEGVAGRGEDAPVGHVLCVLGCVCV